MPTASHRARLLVSLFLALVFQVASSPANSGPIPTLFLHGANRPPPALFVDAAAPSAAAPKSADSPALAFGAGNNRWKEVGVWNAARGAIVGTIDDPIALRVYLGLKNDVDRNARFDVRAELYKNGQLLTSGQAACIAGLRADPQQAKEIVVAFAALPQAAVGAGDAVSVRVLARMGTAPSGAACGGPGQATALRMYFDAVARASQVFAPEALVGSADWNTGLGATADRRALSRAVGPTSASLAWQGARPSLLGLQAVVEGDIVVSTQVEAYDAANTWIVAQDVVSGSELWRTQLPNEASGGWSRVSAFRDGRVYATRGGINGVQDNLYALNAADGSVIWTSQAIVDDSFADSPAFSPEGDVIVGNSLGLVRISRLDGSTVWNTAPSGFTMPTVVGNRVYAWDYVGGYAISVFDVATGNKLFSSDVVEVGAFPAASTILSGPGGMLFVGNGDAVGAHFVALQDLGSSLVVKWTVPMANLAFASFGLGPDGSVYTYSLANEVLRLDPATGGVVNTSMPLLPAGFGLYAPRIAIDAAGKVFVTATDLAGGALYAFNPDLTLRWTDGVPNVNFGGPALAHDGTLIVSGEAVRAYKSP